MASTVVAKKSVKKGVIQVRARKPTHFHLRILSRHPSISDLRKKNILVKGARVVYRHGSTTNGNFEYEINSVDSIKNSADKLLMKQCFDKAEIKHSPWFYLGDLETKKDKWQEFLKKTLFGAKDVFLIAKQRYGSRGTGNYLIKTKEELDKFLKDKRTTLVNYIIEEYKKYSVEYRIHATEHDYFYTCRKVLKNDTPKDQRFQRHDDNCSWLVEENVKFNKPANWEEIIKDCQKAVVALGADMLAFDVKCTSVKDSKDKNCKYIIIESCSAPSFGNRTTEEYVKEIPKVIKAKYNL